MRGPSSSFRDAVYAVVARIPSGHVLTYGQVALVLGAPRAARQVGGALHLLPEESAVPWHRVVNRHGGISTRRPERSMWEQADRLRAEGVPVDGRLQLDLARHAWRPDRATLAGLGLAPELLHAVQALLERGAAGRDRRGGGGGSSPATAP